MESKKPMSVKQTFAVRLEEIDVRFIARQVWLTNTRGDPYRRPYTAADFFRALTITARKAYEAYVSGVAEEEAPTFMEWWLQELPRFSQFLRDHPRGAKRIGRKRGTRT